MNEASESKNFIKEEYTKAFKEVQDFFDTEFEKLKPANLCPKCKLYKSGQNCEFYPKSYITKLPVSCDMRFWQEAILDFVQTKASSIISQKISEFSARQKKYRCAGCGICCKLAASEFSYEELLKKAKEGDKFAKDFTSVFVPYKDKNEALAVFPSYTDLLRKSREDFDNTHFYYCPKLDKNNRCSDYQNRPDVCKMFPNNPLVILPSCCGFYGWKKEIDKDALYAHAMIEISEFYKEKIKEALK